MFLAACKDGCCRFVLHNNYVTIFNNKDTQKIVSIKDFERYWYITDTIENRCALVDDCIEYIIWEGYDAHYPYWFLDYMWTDIDDTDGSHPFAIEESSPIEIDDVFVMNYLGECKHMHKEYFNKYFYRVKE